MLICSASSFLLLSTHTMNLLMVGELWTALLMFFVKLSSCTPGLGFDSLGWVLCSCQILCCTSIFIGILELTFTIMFEQLKMRKGSRGSLLSRGEHISMKIDNLTEPK